MPPTFIVVLFYIFEFLYQIQSSIVQQMFIKIHIQICIL